MSRSRWQIGWSGRHYGTVGPRDEAAKDIPVVGRHDATCRDAEISLDHGFAAGSSSSLGLVCAGSPTAALDGSRQDGGVLNSDLVPVWRPTRPR